MSGSRSLRSNAVVRRLVVAAQGPRARRGPDQGLVKRGAARLAGECVGVKRLGCAANRPRRRGGGAAQGGAETARRRGCGRPGSAPRRRSARCAADENRLASSARSACSIARATGPSAVSTSRSAGPSIPSRRTASVGTRRRHSERDASSPMAQAAKPVGDLLVGAGEQARFAGEQLLIDDRRLGADPGDGPDAVVGVQVVAPAGRRRRRRRRRPRPGVVGQAEDGMCRVAERRGQRGDVGRHVRRHRGSGCGPSSRRAHRAPHRRGGRERRRTRRRTSRDRGRPSRSFSRRASAAKSPPARVWKDQWWYAVSSTAPPAGVAHAGAPAAVYAGTITATWSRSGSSARVEISRAIGRPLESCSTCAPRAESASGWASRTDGCRRTVVAGDLDLLGGADQQDDPRAKRLALRQVEGVAPRQVGRAELGVDGLVDLDVLGSRRRIRVHDGAGREPGDVAGPEQVVRDGAGRLVGRMVDVARGQLERGGEPPGGRRGGGHRRRAGWLPPAEEGQLGHQTGTVTRRSAACWLARPAARAATCASTALRSATTGPGPARDAEAVVAHAEAGRPGTDRRRRVHRLHPLEDVGGDRESRKDAVVSGSRISS